MNSVDSINKDTTSSTVSTSNSVGITFNLARLHLIVDKLTVIARDLNAESLAAYPAGNYRELDYQSVCALQATMIFKGAAALKEIELNYTELNEKVNYCEQRLDQLQKFYYQAADTDTKDLLTSITELNTLLLNNKKLKEQALQKTFIIELPVAVHDALKELKLI